MRLCVHAIYSRSFFTSLTVSMKFRLRVRELRRRQMFVTPSLFCKRRICAPGQPDSAPQV
ncbi:uncharacterized protein MICPUCDRAFT_64996 [Micromonas pusilla CCMP1545]|uniref:Predicted protein n=1 Tax=Micromonas pusilla (strain CCMP1545) TaxID=564608 RepID=C1MLE3_MICPC|nr:uncharacterized protein MICPUCDRAFT_64996 [Micromonas pusilla CCMP1545]EEH59527.1 predicted protein [Micromonas pusilla CCMP1545]|eukprot:XP_003056151.1 predicted protein [Micromonas pusilla CCMP1545]